ncbi:MAG TPA: aldehyde dehydrogenase family protein [Terrimicrobiaceae bacterium]
MTGDPTVWRRRSPGDLSVELPEVSTGDVPAAVERSKRAFAGWRRLSLEARKAALALCRERLKAKQEELARLIALEVGKPLREARLELAAVVAKFELTFSDGDRYLADQSIADGPHPATVRRRARGPAAVVAPFNFPIHLGHGAALAYLLAGNTVIFKPSPLAANVGAAYAAEMQAVLPEGVFELVQGWGATGRALCLHPGVRSVCFTGSIPVGMALAKELAADYSKSLALELGGKNALIVFPDADLDRAADATADGLCLTAGQRCNSTSRILVHRDVEERFIGKLLDSLRRYLPGDPMNEATTLGPLANESALDRYREVTNRPGEWLLAGEVCSEVSGKRGYYVKPAILCSRESLSLGEQEVFCPVASFESFLNFADAIARHESTPFGLAAAIFTSSEQTFRSAGEALEVGNLYWNLPTTFSPSTLPFGGLRASGNGKPGARGFIRFAADEQAVQWTA